tara:strand:- start:455 stop:835 length:381 start_codon:yes stop_codon:yes gene_type:complete
MKRILIALFALQLSGCALWDIYNLSSYDTNEYALVNKVRTIAQTSKVCDEVTVKNLYLTTVELNNFSQYVKGNNSSNIKMNEGLLKIVTELYDREQPVSSAYCKAKLNIIGISAERIQQVTGSKQK